LIQRNNFLLTDLNVHRVVITAVLLAAKFFDDAYYNNAYYSKIGGVLVSEINGLEVDFLFRINFSLHVTPEIFEKYQAELWSHSVLTVVSMPVASPLHQATYSVALETLPSVPQSTGFPRELQHFSTVKVTTQITPSPPAEARKKDEFFAQDLIAAHNIHSSFTADHFPPTVDFLPMYRANSLPVDVTSNVDYEYYQPRMALQRCAQNQAMPYEDSPYLVENTMYSNPIQFAPPAQNVAYAAREAVQRLGQHMLSGATAL
jgi:Cyclin